MQFELKVNIINKRKTNCSYLKIYNFRLQMLLVLGCRKIICCEQNYLEEYALWEGVFCEALRSSLGLQAKLQSCPTRLVF